jgi:hypothetical protein
LQIGRQGDRETFPRMSKIHILRAVGCAPSNAKHVAVGKKSVRANEYAARPKESKFGKPGDNFELCRRHSGISQTDGGLRELAKCGRRGWLFRAIYKCPQRFRVWPHIGHALGPAQVAKSEIPVLSCLYGTRGKVSTKVCD